MDDDDDEEDDEGAMTPPIDNTPPSTQDTKAKKDNSAIPHVGHEVPVSICEEPEPEPLDIISEQLGSTPLSYEEVVPVDIDSCTYHGKKDLKKGKKKSKVSEYAVFEEPPPPPAPYEEFKAPVADANDSWGNFGVSAINKKSTNKKKGKSALGMFEFGE